MDRCSLSPTSSARFFTQLLIIDREVRSLSLSSCGEMREGRGSHRRVVVVVTVVAFIVVENLINIMKMLKCDTVAQEFG